MRFEQRVWTPSEGWRPSRPTDEGTLADADLVIYFASPSAMREGTQLAQLAEIYPRARLIGCSTGGEIADYSVLEDSIVATAVSFDSVTIGTASTSIRSVPDSTAAGAVLASDLGARDLRAVFVLADGLNVNGSELVKGLSDALGPAVVITGGLAGDGDAFQSTAVGLGPAPRPGTLAAVGFYGDAVAVGYGYHAGWDPLGPERRITRSEGNVLYTLDDLPALELYKRYLGEEAEGLPGSAFLFPLRIWDDREGSGPAVIRTILGIDEGNGSMTFAGDMPQGHAAQFMHGNLDRLVDSAERAAAEARRGAKTDRGLALLVSCIGRKLLLDQRTGEEVEAAVKALGDGFLAAGFYSYGEICPQGPGGPSDLHNQTMTVTVIGEQ
jgi:hypothetical protein